MKSSFNPRRIGRRVARWGFLLLVVLALRTSANQPHWDIPVHIWGRGQIYHLAWSPDGTALALAGSRGLWLCDAGLEACRLWSQVGDVTSVAYSPDGRYLATGTYHSAVVVWDVTAPDTPYLMWPYPSRWRMINKEVRAVAFSPDGTRLATGDSSGAMRVWDFSTGDIILMLPHNGAITQLMFDSDGQVLAGAAKKSDVVQVRDISGGSGVRLYGAAWDVALNDLVWRADGAQIAAVTAQGNLLVWNVDGELQWMQRAGGGECFSIDWSRDGRWLVTASGDGRVRVWDAQSSDLQRVLTPDAHGAAVVAVRFNPTSQTLALATADGQVSVWPLEGNVPQAVLESSAPQVQRIAVTTDGHTLAVGGAAGWVSLWEWGADHPWWMQRAHAGAVTTVRFSPDQRWLITASPEDTLHVWDAQTGALATTLPITRGVDSAVFSPDGQWLYVVICKSASDLSSRYQGLLTRWQFASEGGVQQDIAWGDYETNSVFAVTPDGLLLLAGSHGENDVQNVLWDPIQKKVLGAFAQTPEASRYTFSSDARWLATVAEDSNVDLRQAQDMSRRGPMLAGHQSTVLAVAFSPDAKTLASGDASGIIYLWDVNLAYTLLMIESHHGVVQDLVFAPDGRFLISGGDDNTLRVWNVRNLMPLTGGTPGTLTPSVASVLVPTASSNTHQQTTPVSSTPSVSAQTWEIVNPMQAGDFQRLYPDVSGITAIDVYQDTLIAAGSGKIYHHQLTADAHVWRAIKTDAFSFGVDSWAIGMVAENDFWVVGMRGQLAHFYGQAWEKVTGPTQDHLWDIQMFGPDDGWIVGENSAIWRYREQQWITVTAPTTHTLYAVDFVSPDEAWAAGREGTLVHYINGVWQRVPSPTGEHLRGLDMVSADLGWAVGAGGVILRYNGRTWERFPSPTTTNLHSVSAPSPDVAWAVGAEGVMVYWDGEQWALEPQFTSQTFWVVRMLSPDEGWAMAGLRLRDVLLHFEHGAWQLVSAPFNRPSAVDMADTTGWVFADPGFGRQYVDGEWRMVPEVDFAVRVVDMVSDQEAWAIGEKQFYHWVDGVWHDSITTTCSLNDMAMLDARTGWALGQGCALRYTAGTWETVPISAEWRIHALGVVSASEVWASGWIRYGRTPYLFHFKDGDWEVLENPAQSVLCCFSILPSGEAWAGSSRQIYQLQEGRWQLSAFPAFQRELKDLDMVSATEGWALDEGGNVYVYDGTEWRFLTAVNSSQELVRRPNGEVWIFGYGGVWYRQP